MQEPLVETEGETSGQPCRRTSAVARTLLVAAFSGAGLLCLRGGGQWTAASRHAALRQPEQTDSASSLDVAEADGPKVFVIRHGEKSPEFLYDLDSRGRARADYIANHAESLFDMDIAAAQKPGRTWLFARSAGPPGFQYREVETLLPLSRRLGIPVNTIYDVDHEAELAAAIFSELAVTPQSTVIVAWEHCRMPRFLQALGCDTEDCRRCWADGEFDQYFELTHLPGAAKRGSETPPSLVVRKRFEGFLEDAVETLRLRAEDPGAVDDSRYQCWREASEINSTLQGRFQCEPVRPLHL